MLFKLTLLNIKIHFFFYNQYKGDTTSIDQIYTSAHAMLI